MRILLIEDEPEMATALRGALTRYAMAVDHVTTIAAAEAAIVDNVHDAILLDRQLPDGDGLRVITQLRARGMAAPVIVLTARGDVADRITGLNTGADDYLAKPFSIDELLARIRAVLRRPTALSSNTIKVGRLTFDFDHRTASVHGELLNLPRRELLVLETLMRRTGRTVLRASLEEAVYASTMRSSPTRSTHMCRGYGASSPMPTLVWRFMESAAWVTCCGTRHEERTSTLA